MSAMRKQPANLPGAIKQLTTAIEALAKGYKTKSKSSAVGVGYRAGRVETIQTHARIIASLGIAIRLPETMATKEPIVVDEAAGDQDAQWTALLDAVEALENQQSAAVADHAGSWFGTNPSGGQFPALLANLVAVRDSHAPMMDLTVEPAAAPAPAEEAELVFGLEDRLPPAQLPPASGALTIRCISTAPEWLRFDPLAETLSGVVPPFSPNTMTLNPLIPPSPPGGWAASSAFASFAFYVAPSAALLEVTGRHPELGSSVPRLMPAEDSDAAVAVLAVSTVPTPDFFEMPFHPSGQHRYGLGGRMRAWPTHQDLASLVSVQAPAAAPVQVVMDPAPLSLQDQLSRSATELTAARHQLIKLEKNLGSVMTAALAEKREALVAQHDVERARRLGTGAKNRKADVRRLRQLRELTLTEGEMAKLEAPVVQAQSSVSFWAQQHNHLVEAQIAASADM